MRTVAFTEFRRNASKLLDAVERGETILVQRHGKVVAELTAAAGSGHVPSWKRPVHPLVTSGKSLARMILEERESGW